MNLEPKLKQLVNAYLAEVGIHLPGKKRQDITAEIHSLILDALEDRVQGRPPDEATLMAVLRELGSPADMAARYDAHNYVIGPKLYAPFIVTVRGTLLFMAVFFLLGFILSWEEATASPAAFGSTLWGMALAYLKNALQNFSVIVLVFILLEKTLPDQDWFEQTKVWRVFVEIPFLRETFGQAQAPRTWDPVELTVTPKTQPVKRGEAVFITALTILAILLFNFFPHLVGIYGFLDGEPWRMPFLAPAFRVYLPGWNLYWLLTLIFQIGLITNGRWTRLARWGEVGLMAFSGMLVYWMLRGPEVIGINPDFLALSAINVAEGSIIPILATIFDIILVLHLVVTVPTVIYKVFNLLGWPPVLILRSRP